MKSPISIIGCVACLIIILVSGAVKANSTSEAALSSALAQHDLDAALVLMKTMTGPEIESVAAAPAKSGLIPAMWFMGQARHLAGDEQGSADWLYAALLGSRLDVSLCSQSDASGVLYFLTRGLHDAVIAARINVQRRSAATLAAVRYFQQLPHADNQAGWTCRWAEKRGLLAKKDAKFLLINPKRWDDARARQMNTFRKEVGISHSMLETDTIGFTSFLPGVPGDHQ